MTLLQLNYQTVIDVTLLVTVLSLFIERALSVIFEYQLYIKYITGRGLKTPITFLISWFSVRFWKIDVMSMMLNVPPSAWGYFFTAAIVAGGSKGSLKLFRDVLKIRPIPR